MEMIPNIRIGVFMGGSSTERDVSFKSGKAVYNALRDSGCDALAIDIKKEDREYIKDLIYSYNIGFAFLALHGGSGEDGTIQKILEELGLPYTGSGPKASYLAMDKIASRRIFKSAGLNVPRCCVLDEHKRDAEGLDNFPLVVKPACGGSSVGLSIVDNRKELKAAIDLAFQYDRCVLVEEYILGREMTVGVLEDKPLPAIEIKPKSRFFDYKAKYEHGQSEYIVPACVPKKIMQLLQDAGSRAHKSLGCAFFSRTDIILNKEAKPFVLEVNTIPGFTSTSLLPMAVGACGIGFAELVLKIIEAGLLRCEKARAGFIGKNAFAQ